MYDFTLKIAELNIHICSHFSFMKDFCKDYISTEKKIDLQANVTMEEIQSELSYVKETVKIEYAEWLCIYRKIAEQIPKYERCVIHGAAISYKGNAFLFTAPSGTGKTTHIRLWRRYLGQAVNIINGDKPILQITKDAVIAYGTPWAGKEGWQKNISAPLKGICFLRKAEKNKIVEINPYEYIADILQQVYMPKNEENTLKTLELVKILLEKVKFYVIYCDMSEEAVKIVFEMLTGEKYIRGADR